MTQNRRLPTGGRIDRRRALEFSFNGRRLSGYAGDTLASALLANDCHLVARSFKYHRPRGIVAAGAEEPNAIFQIGAGNRGLPNQRATQTELYAGLEASSVNCWPGPDFDVGSALGLFSRMLPAGFYYKTFMWPSEFWERYEHVIRRSAGLGLVPEGPDPDWYDRVHAHCDVLVVGAGPAGLMAALVAGRAGARVVLADEQSEFGGSLLSSTATVGGQHAWQWIASLLSELQDMDNVQMLPRSTVFGYYDHNFLAIAERLGDHQTPAEAAPGPRQRLWGVRAKRVVIAAGAIERPLVFCNNDRPGVMLASAVSSYLNRYAVAPGTRAVVLTNNDSAYAAALDMREAGIEVAAIVDVRPEPRGALPNRARDAGLSILAGHAVVDTQGVRRMEGAKVAPLDVAGRGLTRNTLEGVGCDLLAVSGGWSPAVHLHSQSGGRAVFDDAKVCFVPGNSRQPEQSAGASNGSFDLGACLAEGMSAGREACRAAGLRRAREIEVPEVMSEDQEPLQPLWLVPHLKSSGRGPKQFVDYQNDTTAGDIKLAVREGYHSVEHVKRYTALGFGTDQGKLGNINGMAILAETLGAAIPEVGTTTFRPAYTPVAFGTLAGPDVGELFDPVRCTAMHAWHEENGAEFENVGLWKRPWYYPRGAESMQAAVDRECLAARTGVAIMDASTLGKIDVRGPDAAEFLDRIYTNGWKKLGVGRCRYGLMLGEDGMVMDDGVTTRLAEDRYYMTTTTGGAAHVLSWMERWLQTEWPDLKVYLTSLTDQWATAAVVGPKCREVLSSITEGVDFSSAEFPFMSMREGRVAGIPARIFRISFSGELSYEINVSADFGRHVWEAFMAAGQASDITPYGTEAMHVLRAEKGFIIVGQDTDGSVTPDDLGYARMLAKHKDFLGKRSLARADCVRQDRKQLVGLETLKPDLVLPEGAQLVEDPDAPKPVPMIGHVTSSYHSACLGRSIALAVVKGGRQRMDEVVYAPLTDGRTVRARICSPVFYDPEGTRQND